MPGFGFETEAAPTRALPHSREAEEAVVGSVLINEYLLDELTDLQPEDFYIHRLRFIWEAYLRLRERKSAIDSLTVSEELDDFGRLAEVGGPAYLTALLNQVPTTLHVEAYSEIIKACSVRRKLLLAANKIAALAYDQTLEMSEVTSQASAAVTQALQSVGDNDGALNFAEAAGELYDRMVARSTAAESGGPMQLVKRVLSPWKAVNAMLGGGFGAGRLYVPAGRPGEGKSSWMAGIAKAVAAGGGTAAIFSLEMPGYEVVARIMAGETGVAANILDDGVPRPEDWEKIVAGMEAMGKMTGGWAFYTPGITPSRLRAKAHRLKAKYGLDLLILDYIQLMRGDGRGSNREQEIASITRELKTLAGELNLPILAAAQLSRDVVKRSQKPNGTKEPDLTDLRESGAIENDADAVIFLWRDDPEAEFSNVQFAKHRNGPIGKVSLRFDRAFTQFLDVE